MGGISGSAASHVLTRHAEISGQGQVMFCDSDPKGFQDAAGAAGRGCCTWSRVSRLIWSNVGARQNCLPHRASLFPLSESKVNGRAELPEKMIQVYPECNVAFCISVSKIRAAAHFSAADWMIPTQNISKVDSEQQKLVLCQGNLKQITAC